MAVASTKAVSSFTKRQHKHPYGYLSLCDFHLRKPLVGRAVAQAVSRWLPTAATRVRIRVACGVCGGQSGTGAGFLRVLLFPPLIFIPPISPQSPSPITRGWYNRPVVAAIPKVPPHKLKKKKVVSLTRRPHFTPRKIRGSHFC
jgi:hypothetical protein